MAATPGACFVGEMMHISIPPRKRTTTAQNANYIVALGVVASVEAVGMDVMGRDAIGWGVLVPEEAEG